MDFVLSKVLWLLVQPSHFLFFSIMLSAALALDVRRRWAARTTVLLAVLLIAVSALPVGIWLRQPLEDRFPRPDSAPAEVTGIIVLGGAQVPSVTHARGVLAINESSERFVEALALSRRFPDAQVVMTGGSAALFANANENEVNRLFIEQSGMDADRVRHETLSRNTYENAVYSRTMVDPLPGDVWLLVTTAAHMPRSVGIFRALDWPVIPWPVDYRTTGEGLSLFVLDMGSRLAQLDEVAREWVGLAAYRIMGRTDAFFPGPATP